MTNQTKIKDEIVSALSHPEAEEGLFLANLLVVHEEDDRPQVSGNDKEILSAIESLIVDKKVSLTHDQGRVVFIMA